MHAKGGLHGTEEVDDGWVFSVTRGGRLEVRRREEGGGGSIEPGGPRAVVETPTFARGLDLYGTT